MNKRSDKIDSVVTRLKRAQGQLGGIIAMIEEGRDCRDVVTQIAAVSKAVDRAGYAFIMHNLKGCIENDEKTDVDAKVDELEKLFLSLA